MIRPHLLLLVTFGLPLTGCATETSMTLAPPMALLQTDPIFGDLSCRE